MATISKRKAKDGSVSHSVKIRLKGYPAQSATFKRLTDARKWAQATEASIREGRHFKTAEAKKHTLSDLIKRYKETVLPTKSQSMIRDQSQQLSWWNDKIGCYLLSDLTTALISETKDVLATTKSRYGKLKSPATVNRYLAALSHVCSIASKEWGWLEDNPVLKVTKAKEAKPKVRFLSEDELPNLLSVCKNYPDSYLYLVVFLALSTGARKMEILGLSWNDVNLSRNVMVLHDTKNKEIRLLPLVGKARQLMTEHSKTKRSDTNFVFPSKNGKNPMDIRASWNNALKEANIENFRFHDLRHTAASYLAMNGATSTDVAEVLGHKSIAMAKRYSHLSEAHTAGVVESMNNKFLAED